MDDAQVRAAIGVPVAAGVLYPFFGILLSPILAAAAMSFSSVSVIVNSLRLEEAGFVSPGAAYGVRTRLATSGPSRRKCSTFQLRIVSAFAFSAQRASRAS